jgi:hypothetical protein
MATRMNLRSQQTIPDGEELIETGKRSNADGSGQ